MSGTMRKSVQTVCGRALRGLYGGRTIRFGNNVSEQGGNKTRRSWKPNAVRKRVFSELLGCMLPLSLTTHTLRCIDKAGGLDAYVLNARDSELGTGVGPALRQELLFAAAVRRAEAEEAAAAAAPPPAEAEEAAAAAAGSRKE